MSVFIQQALRHMNTELNRIEESISRLTDTQIWTRLRENTNSIGSLCNHLSGNEYQNIISGIGGKPFIRERSLEFAVNEGMNGKDLIANMRNIRKQSEQILNGLTENDFNKEIEIHYSKQDWDRIKERKNSENELTYNTYPSIQSLLFHVTEHYGYHTGQIVLITKILQSGLQNITEFRH